MKPSAAIAAARKAICSVVRSSVLSKPAAPCKAAMSCSLIAENFVRRQAMDPNPRTRIVIRTAMSKGGLYCWRKKLLPRKETRERKTVAIKKPATVAAAALWRRANSVWTISPAWFESFKGTPEGPQQKYRCSLQSGMPEWKSARLESATGPIPEFSHIARLKVLREQGSASLSAQHQSPHSHFPV